MGSINVKGNKNTTSESSTPKPPPGMPNPMEYDIQDIEEPDDVFIPTQHRYLAKFRSTFLGNNFPQS